MSSPGGNRRGVVGLWASALGLLTGGLLSPVGLILSLSGLREEPRRAAAAGALLGAIGTAGGATLVFLFGAPMVVRVLRPDPLAGLAPEVRTQIESDMAQIAATARAYRDEHGAPPRDLNAIRAELSDSVRKGPWGGLYLLQPGDDGWCFRIRSAGPDNRLATKDDIVVDYE